MPLIGRGSPQALPTHRRPGATASQLEAPPKRCPQIPALVPLAPLRHAHGLARGLRRLRAGEPQVLAE
eukprot:974833-Alexandrium_andersonii.AAC.1